MNKKYIERAIVSPALRSAMVEIKKVYHIYCDGSPENAGIWEEIINAENAISKLIDKIERRA